MSLFDAFSTCILYLPNMPSKMKFFLSIVKGELVRVLDEDDIVTMIMTLLHKISLSIITQGKSTKPD